MSFSKIALVTFVMFRLNVGIAYASNRSNGEYSSSGFGGRDVWFSFSGGPYSDAHKLFLKLFANRSAKVLKQDEPELMSYAYSDGIIYRTWVQRTKVELKQMICRETVTQKTETTSSGVFYRQKYYYYSCDGSSEIN